MVVITINIPELMRQKIDRLRGDIARSRFISKLLDAALIQEKSDDNSTHPSEFGGQ